MNKRIVFGAGRPIFKQGDRDRELYFIVKGEIDLIVRDEHTGAEAIVSTISGKSVLGTMSFLEGEPRSATAMTKTEVTYFKITEVVRERILKRVPTWFGILIKDLTRSIRDIDKKYLSLLAEIDSQNKKATSKDKTIERIEADIERMKQIALEQKEKEETLVTKLKETEAALKAAKAELTDCQQKLQASKR